MSVPAAALPPPRQPGSPYTVCLVCLGNICRSPMAEVVLRSELAEAGLAAGGSEPRPAEDYGFMYSRDLEDPDGNIVAFHWMAPQAIEQGPEAYMAQQAQV